MKQQWQKLSVFTSSQIFIAPFKPKMYEIGGRALCEWQCDQLDLVIKLPENLYLFLFLLCMCKHMYETKHTYIYINLCESICLNNIACIAKKGRTAFSSATAWQKQRKKSLPLLIFILFYSSVWNNSESLYIWTHVS